ncbi:MAG: hypothetical protein GY761_16250 [Hyphomicrobiales bacterium]|nr:hypothetical protein [Hyphomicrobiales bacterium]
MVIAEDNTVIDEEKLEGVILDTLSHDFDGVKLLRVKVTPDYDFDGDDILRVEVVFAGEPKDLAPNLLVKAIRSIRPKLSEFNVFAFPSVSFVSAKDAKITIS